MMLAVYFVLAWSLVGFLAAVLMGRAIAICYGEQHEGAESAGATRAARTNADKDVRTARAA
jgi:hypothetical protein